MFQGAANELLCIYQLMGGSVMLGSIGLWIAFGLIIENTEDFSDAQIFGMVIMAIAATIGTIGSCSWMGYFSLVCWQCNNVDDDCCC